MFSIRIAAVTLLAGALSSAASAASVEYTFSTATGLTGAGHIAALLGADAKVEGSFTYNNSGTFYGASGALGYEPGYAIYAPSTTPGTLASFRGLAGHVGARSFSDIFGSVNVGNDVATLSGADVLSLSADPIPKLGQNTLPTDFQRQLQGFTVGDYTLSNVRLYWTESLTQPDFLASYALPTTLPAFKGRLMLEFVRTDDPTNTAGLPYGSNTVYFDGLTVQAAPVPEPTSAALMLAGFMVAGGMLARRRVR
jgi:hypothetical protein